ncbi:hypothetical protein AYO49_02155 [Verrucomicrobiaceae bacterium SCGC AG-212-N21]|nr:hypothetical protein AYO49_02155 [Verrucomicrobiaceae bacterium SCGC AG-212-N21]
MVTLVKLQTLGMIPLLALHRAHQMSQEFLYCGEFISDEGVEPVARALADCSWRIELRRSGYDGTLYLMTPHSQEIDLEMDSGQSRHFLFSGAVDGTVERALTLLADFSRCLTAGGCTHRVEVYDDAKALIGYFHHRWTKEQHEPAD